MIRAVSFDAGGTLFHPARPAGEVYAEVAARWGCHADPGEIQERFAGVWKAWSAADPGRTTVTTPEEERGWWKALVREVFRDRGEFRDFDSFFDELYGEFAAPEAWTLYPEAIPTLERLRTASVPMVVVSNWDSRLDVLCERMGISGYFVAILASGRLGFSKPDPRIFATALDRLGGCADEVVHIGDSLRDDVHGALRSGMRAVWLRRAAGDPGSPPVPQAVGREADGDPAPEGVPTASSLDEAVGLMVS